jgi:hypothetical protein
MRVTLAASRFDEGSGGVAKGQVEIFLAQDRVDGTHGLLIALPFGRQSVSLDSDLEPVDVVPVPPFMASSTGPAPSHSIPNLFCRVCPNQLNLTRPGGCLRHGP